MPNSPMLKSDVVDVQGHFIGTAITYAREAGVVFMATHEAARPLHGCRFASLEVAREAAAGRWSVSERPSSAAGAEIG